MLGTLFLLAVLGFFWYYNQRRPKDFPPGPIGLPIVGNIMSMNYEYPHLTLSKWANKYGGLFSVRIGNSDVVLVADPRMVKEVMGKTEVADRPNMVALTRAKDGQYGIIAANGHLWHENRRFTLRHLRDLGMGKSQMTDIIREEVLDFMKENLETNVGKEVNLFLKINIAVTNIIWTVISGFRMKHGDQTIINLLQDLGKLVRVSTRASLLENFPWLQPFIPNSIVDYEIYRKFTNKFFDTYGGKIIRDHKTDNENNDDGDYVYRYLRKIDEEGEGNPKGIFSEWSLLNNIDDLFVAGGETTSTTIRWIFFYLCKRPDIQKRIQDEIDEHIGRDRFPEYTDTENMHLTQAFCGEIHRKASVAPVGIPRQTSADCSVGKYRIPKGTQVWLLAHHIHHDPNLWKNPAEFDLENFLDDNGHYYEPKDQLLPFGAGRRRCIGENLVKYELFLFVTTVLQKYTVRFPEGMDYSDEPTKAYILSPYPHMVVPYRRE